MAGDGRLSYWQDGPCHASGSRGKLTVGEGKQTWTACELVIDLRSGQFEVSFGYEDLGI